MNNKKINHFKTKPCKVKEMKLQKLEQQRKLQYTKPETFYLNSKKDSVLTALESLNNKKD
jgi:hypothetical protein